MADDKGLALINRMHRELKGLGVGARVFEDGRPDDPALFENLEAMYGEIDRELGIDGDGAGR